ncbi:TPA: DUF4430 domain-containing protein [Streptococcus suis]
MKKIILCVTLFLVSLLTACSSGETTSSTDVLYKAVIEVTAQGNTSSKEVQFEKGDTVMDVLEEHYEIEEESGLVTSIDGVSQDVNTQTYWLYKINGEFAEKGAAQQEVAEGDKIEFYLEKMQ